MSIIYKCDICNRQYGEGCVRPLILMRSFFVEQTKIHNALDFYEDDLHICDSCHVKLANLLMDFIFTEKAKESKVRASAKPVGTGRISHRI